MKTKYLLAVDRYIDKDGPAIRPAGFVTRDLAHWHGVPHTTVLLVPVRSLDNGQFEVLIHRRPKNKKVSPDTWDTFGGHVDIFIHDGKVVPPADKLNERNVFRKIIDETAIREANEEIKIPDFQFTAREIHRFGGYGDFEYGVNVPGSNNVEYSTLYVALLPRDATKITATDTVSIAGVEVEVANLKLKSVSLDDLMMDYRDNKSEYADGLGRILDKFSSSPGTEYSFNTFLSSVIQSI
jgi:8-oxo-dGTP pyrophosphatase MutT (NUDIX family)